MKRWTIFFIIGIAFIVVTSGNANHGGNAERILPLKKLTLKVRTEAKLSNPINKNQEHIYDPSSPASVFCSNLWAKLQLFNDVDKNSKAWLCLVSLLVSDQLYTAAVYIALEPAQFPHYFIEWHLQNGRN